MKKLNKKQIEAIRGLLCNIDGTLNRKIAIDALLCLRRLMNCHRIHYRRAGSRGKRSTVIAAVMLAVDVCKAMGYTVSHHNDAPRGGELGDYYLKDGRKADFNAGEFLEVIGAEVRRLAYVVGHTDLNA